MKPTRRIGREDYCLILVTAAPNDGKDWSESLLTSDTHLLVDSNAGCAFEGRGHVEVLRSVITGDGLNASTCCRRDKLLNPNELAGRIQ
jgi:hypothetical protein